MEKKDLGLGIGAVVLGMATLVYFLGLPGNAGYYPKLISIAIIILGLVIALNAVRALKTVSAKEEKPGGKTIAYPAVMLIIAYLAVYYFAFHKFSYTISTFLLVMATSVTLGYRKWKILVPVAALMSVGLYLAFTQVFHVRFMAMFF